MLGVIVKELNSLTYLSFTSFCAPNNPVRLMIKFLCKQNS